MRSIAVLIILVISISCTGPKKTSMSAGKFDGTWVPISEEINGTALPKGAFEKQKLVLHDSTYAFTAESTDKGIVQYSGDKMDIYGKEGVNTGKHFTAIYKYENELLTICYNLGGDSYPIAFETKSKPTLFLVVFKKEGGQ